MSDYAVDLGELDSVVGHAGDLTNQVELWLHDLEALLSRLHETWSGQAASAQLEAHQRWVLGTRHMHNSLHALKASAHTAHTNYSSAVAANSKMWQ